MQWRVTLVCWVATIAIVVVYAVFMRERILAHSAIPYFDQASYVDKVSTLSHMLASADGVRSILNPYTLLAAPPAHRGFLMPLAAAVIVGGDADPRSMALVWLTIRLIVLVAALVLLAHVARRSEFVPAAALLILGSSSQLMLNPSLFMMDQSYECFSLLAFALVLYDLQTRTVLSAALVGIGALLLVFVRPAGAVFMAPLYGLIALVFLFRDRRWRWIVPHALTVLALLLIAVSPYAEGNRIHYQLASTGYWLRPYTVSEVFTWLVLITPLWVVGLALFSLVRHRTRGLPAGLLTATVLSVAGWLAVNMLLMYTSDSRIIAAIAPIAMSAAAIVICRTRMLAVLLIAVSTVFFGVSVAAAAGRFVSPAGLDYVHVIPYPQAPVAEVGLVPLMERVVAEIDRTERGRDRVTLMALVNDDYVDNAGLPLAVRRVSDPAAARVGFAVLHWGSDPAALDSVLDVRWFLTKAKRSTSELGGDAWTVLEASDALITDPSSPLKGYFEPRFSHTVRQPDLVDEITLWRLKRRPTAQVYLDALQWLEPRFRATPGHDALLKRTQTLAEALDRLPNQETDAVQFHIDHLIATTDGTQIDGWAFVEGVRSPTGSIMVVLRAAEGSSEVFTTSRVRRPDVSAHFKRQDLDDSGFSIFLPSTTLSGGSYRMGVYVAAHEVKALRFTAHSFATN